MKDSFDDLVEKRKKQKLTNNWSFLDNAIFSSDNFSISMNSIKRRGFEVVNDYSEKDINTPKRSTKNSAGLDIEAAEDIIIPSLIKNHFSGVLDIAGLNKVEDADLIEKTIKKYVKPTMIPTGLKAYMQNGEVLKIYNRSSNSKRGLMMANNVAIIDQDYYNNSGNEGHIFVPMWNLGLDDVSIKKGERVAQGIFEMYLTPDEADDDNDGTQTTRSGGFGSTGL